MTQTIFDPEKDGGSGWAGFLALGEQLRQWEEQRKARAYQAASEHHAESDDFLSRQAAEAMEIDLSAPYALDFARWIRRRYSPSHWPRLKMGTSAGRCEFQLYLKAQGAFISGEYDVYTRLCKTKPLRFSESRVPRPSHQQTEPQRQAVGA